MFKATFMYINKFYVCVLQILFYFSFQYQIYQKNARGHVSSLEDVWSTLESDQVNKTSSVHRVAEFNAGDQVYIHLSTQYLPLVSLEDDHEFGMFEI